MFCRARQSSRAFVTGTALPWASSAIVSAVNPRFFRFKRPLLLALLVGALTILLTIGIACAVYFLSCRNPQVLVPLNRVTNQTVEKGFRNTCDELLVNNFFVSAKVDTSVGEFGPYASLFPAMLDASVYNWTAEVLYSLANTTPAGEVDRALSDFKTKFDYSYMAAYTLDAPTPPLPGRSGYGESLPWQVQMFNSTTLNGSIPRAPDDCPNQWKIMLNSPRVGVNIEGHELFAKVNVTLNWTCTGYTWLFAEVVDALSDPHVEQGVFKIGAAAPVNGSFSVRAQTSEIAAILAELDESVSGSWFPPIEWCTDLSDAEGRSDSWCATVNYAGLAQEARRHIRKVSPYFPVMKRMEAQARYSLSNWTGELQQSPNGGYILDTADDFRRVRSALILFMSHMSALVSLMTHSQFEREFEQSLQLNNLVCRPRVCDPVIGTIGSALGYTGIIEIIVAFFVLAIYILRSEDEQVNMKQLSEIVFEAVPEDILQAANGKKASDDFRGNGH